MRASVVAAIVLCAWAMSACSPRTDFERMRQQPRVDPFGGSVDGQTMRVPPAGTVAVAQRTAENPVADGRRAFEIHCSVCHGADGAGATAMASNMPEKRPPPLDSSEARQRSDAEVLDIILHGRNRMPSYAWALSEAEQTAVVTYVRQLQHLPPTTGAQP